MVILRDAYIYVIIRTGARRLYTCVQAILCLNQYVFTRLFRVRRMHDMECTTHRTVFTSHVVSRILMSSPAHAGEHSQPPELVLSLYRKAIH